MAEVVAPVVVVPVVVAKPVPEKPPKVEEVQPEKPVKVEKPVEHKLPHFTRPPVHAPVAASEVAPPAPKPLTPGRPARFSEEWVPGGEK
jgi:hypothetical protein